jgi:hypothetical protein
MSSVPPAAKVPGNTPRDVVEGAALPGADRNDLGKDVEIDSGFGGDEHPLDRGDEICVAEILCHQLGGRSGAARPDMEHIGGHRLEQWLVFAESCIAGADHHGHVRWAATDRRIDQFDPARPTSFADARDGLRRIGGEVDMRCSRL